MSRRERRRAKARARDLYVHGVDTRRDGNGQVPRASEPRAFQIMRPRATHATKSSATHRSRQILAEYFGMNGGAPWKPKGLRRVRYTTTVRWNGSRAAGANDGLTDLQPRGVRILKPGK
jgi:hypothetical protein